MPLIIIVIVGVIIGGAISDLLENGIDDTTETREMVSSIQTFFLIVFVFIISLVIGWGIYIFVT